MTPAAAKLLMCVCAGSTGAVMVPAAHKVRAAFNRPAVHRAVANGPARRAAASAIAAAPCVPLASAGGAGGLPGTIPLETPVADLGSFGQRTLAGGNGIGAGSGRGSIGDGGFSVFGPGADFSGALPGGLGNPGGGVISPGTVLTPTSGSVPEPAGWAMMITGFSITGIASRWQRRAVA